jgi:hypothetical protein
LLTVLVVDPSKTAIKNRGNMVGMVEALDEQYMGCHII